MGYGLLNLVSLFLGLIAWLLPVVNLVGQDRGGHKSWAVFSTASLCACMVSLYMQILYSKHLVKIEDWSALMDTSNAVAIASAVLLAGTIALNAITLNIYYKSGVKYAKHVGQNQKG